MTRASSRRGTKVYSTVEAAKVFQCTPATIIAWIDRGLLKAYRTPGQHRRILRDEVARLAAERGVELPEGF